MQTEEKVRGDVGCDGGADAHPDCEKPIYRAGYRGGDRTVVLK